MSESVLGVPVEKIPSMVRQIEEAQSYMKMDPLSELDWGERHRFLWELVRRGDYAAWQDPGIWRELAGPGALKFLSAGDVMDFLVKVTAFDEDSGGAGDDLYEDEYYEDEYYDDGFYDDYGGGGYVEPAFEAERLTEFWPIDLDRLAMHAFATDPATVETRFEECSPEVQLGLKLVMFRFGKVDVEEIKDLVVGPLATTRVRRGFPSNVDMVNAEGELVSMRMDSYSEEGQEGQAKFVAQFATEEEWAGAVLREVKSSPDDFPGFDPTQAAWSVAEPEDLEWFMSRSSLYGDAKAKVFELLLGRSDSPETYWKIAENLAEAGSGRPAELALVAGILKALEVGEEPSNDLVQQITLQSVSTPQDLILDQGQLHLSSGRRPEPGTEEMIRALRALDRDALVARLTEIFDGQYTKTNPYLVLEAVADDEGIVKRAFEMVTTIATGDYGTFTGMDNVVYGLSRLGDALLPELVARWEEAELPLVRDTYHRAILGILADTEKVPEEHERFVNLTHLTSVERDYEVSHRVGPDYKKALESLPRDRALKLALRDARDLENPRWARSFEALEVLREPELVEALFDGVAAGKPTALGDHNWFGKVHNLYYENRELFGPHFGRALAARQDPEFHNKARQILGGQYEEVLAAAGAAAAADTSRAAKLKRLATAYLEANPDAGRTKVYVMERQSDESPDGGTMNRIGGRPFGVTAESWPVKNGDADLPLQHMLTLDAQTMPGLQARLGENVRAVSLFVYTLGGNQAWSPYNSDVEVVLLSDEVGEFEGELPVGEESATAFSVEEVEIPSGAFSVPYDGPEDLRAVRSALYSCNAWSGPMPIWLQGEEHFGELVVQFDEGFVYMNLGDAGIMYVFTDTAFWQCH